MRTSIQFHGHTQVQDVPDQMAEGELYLVMSGRKPFSVAFVCPCGCHDPVELPLVRGNGPRWRAETDPEGHLTLSPSVHKTDGCRSHFFIRQGRVEWC